MSKATTIQQNTNVYIIIVNYYFIYLLIVQEVSDGQIQIAIWFKSRFNSSRDLIWPGKDSIWTPAICDLIRFKEIRDSIQVEKIQMSNRVSEIMLQCTNISV